MALINDPNITAQIRDLANTGTIDTTQILSLLNSVLPAGQQITVGSTITTGIYKRFGDFDKINAKVEVVTTGIWSAGGEGAGQLSEFYTSSTQTTSTDGQFYWNVYDEDPATEETAEVQFAIAYGHKDGSGSVSLSTNPDALLPTKSTYAQYRAMLLDNPSLPFSFETSTPGIFTNSNGIYVINIGRARYREEMDAGNWQLQLSGSSGLFRFIDDSGKKFGDTFGKAGRTFKVVSGSLELGSQGEAIVKSTTGSNGEGLGLFYPDRGIIVLNASAIGSVVGNVTFSTGSAHSESGTLAGGEGTTFNAYNQARLLAAIQNGADFDARRTENVSTQHFFVRATNREFNYSNNPTYVDVNGNFTEPTFLTDPRTFITTIGLYNDSNELVAVAKTSQPVAKSFDKEVLVKVKLSF
jgi:hypothetical protein